jgi:hypothetical protein
MMRRRPWRTLPNNQDRQRQLQRGVASRARDRCARHLAAIERLQTASLALRKSEMGAVALNGALTPDDVPE